MSGKPSDAEDIFRKTEDEMSEIERMMAQIISEEKHQRSQTEPQSHMRSSEFVIPAPPVKRNRPAMNTSFVNNVESIEGNEIISDSAADFSSNNYNTCKIREKEIKQATKKRSSGKVAIISLILVIVLIVAALVYTKVFDDIRFSYPGSATESQRYEEDIPSDEEAAQLASVTFPPDMIFPTPEPDEAVSSGVIHVEAPSGSLVIMSETPPENHNAEHKEHSYMFFTADVSWEEARNQCLELGGHLAVVSNVEELNDIITLCGENGIRKVWLGCHREGDNLVWENNETVDFYAWGKGEPSLYDTGDMVSEDYLLLWYFNGAWVYNDSRNDPVRDYPDMYSGQIGYICEFD